MKLHFKVFAPFLLSLFLGLFFASCDNSSTPVTPDADVTEPTNLQAYADDGKIGLTWTLSVSESQSNFGTYELTYWETGTSGNTQVANIQKGSSSYTITGLVNGKRYTAQLRSKTTAGKTSAGYATIEWSPAVRNSTDMNGQVINLYATTSAQPKSGMVFKNGSNQCEILSQAGADWANRGDIYFFAQSNTSQVLSIKSAHLATGNPGSKTTYFSTMSYDVDDMNASNAQSAPPALSTYTTTSIDFIDQASAKSKVYWGRIQGLGADAASTYTVRFIVMKGANGKLIQGSAADRFITLQVSVQPVAGNPYAKK